MGQEKETGVLQILEEIERGPHLRCVINACGRDLDRIITCQQAMKEMLEIDRVECENGVGFTHVVLKNGEHVGIEHKHWKK